MDSSRSSVPLISVIVPVLNEEKTIGRLLGALQAQTQATDSFKVLLVDNGSTDKTLERIRGHQIHEYLDVRVLEEAGRRSSYAARNLGIHEARSTDCLVFTDADCVPEPDWLCNGIQAMEKTNADLAGGHVRFEFSARPTAAEVVDSFTNLQMQHGIETGGFARTANLFVKRAVFDRLGPFDPSIISGGDIRWTKKATTAGFKLVFVQDAVVAHPARSWCAMIKKQFRVGIGKNAVLGAQGFTRASILKKTLLSLWFPKWQKVQPRITQLSGTEARRRKPGILFALWALRVATTLGQVRSCFSLRRFSRP